MNQQSPSSNSQFIGLTEFSAPSENTTRLSGNILKNIQVAGFKFSDLQIDATCGDEPVVLVKREADVIQSIEFVCSCGKKKIVSFEYEEE